LNYVGSDTFTFTFDPGTGSITKNVCGVVTAGDFTPNPFSFTSLINQPLSTVIYSNIIQISGINQTVVVTITGGEYSKNGGAYTSAAGTAVIGDTFQLRQTSSGSVSTLTAATLTVGGVSGTFNVTTMASTSATLYGANGLYPASRLSIHADDGAGHVYDLNNISQGDNDSRIIVAGTYTITLVYSAPHGPATSPFDINGSSGTLTNNVPLVVSGEVAPIIVGLNLL
jgi:hypothetical protein